jgi:hypothetical protein
MDTTQESRSHLKAGQHSRELLHSFWHSGWLTPTSGTFRRKLLRLSDGFNVDYSVSSIDATRGVVITRYWTGHSRPQQMIDERLPCNAQESRFICFEVIVNLLKLHIDLP